MSFGPTQSVKNDQNQLGGITQSANANSANLNNLGSTALSSGSGNTSAGTNWFNTILNGNQANTSALLAPTVNADRTQNQAALQSASTLMPRGGGRSGTLFQSNLQPTASLQNLFNNGQVTAAQTLPQIGLAQQGIGTNLFGAGNSALNTAANATGTNLNSSLQEQQMSNQLAAGLAGGLFSLATTPFGGGAATNGLLGLIPGCWIAEAIYGKDDLRTHTLRAWLNGPFRKTPRGYLVMKVYLSIGRQVAWFVRRSYRLRILLRPLFEVALLNAVRSSTFVEVG